MLNTFSHYLFLSFFSSAIQLEKLKVLVSKFSIRVIVFDSPMSSITLDHRDVNNSICIRS
ncbi:hypothetical protein Plhal304r1_c034g0106621 [Plasmopara halstedii]